MLDPITFVTGFAVGIALTLVSLFIFDKNGDQSSFLTIKEDHTRLIQQLDKILKLVTLQSESVVASISYLHKDLDTLVRIQETKKTEPLTSSELAINNEEGNEKDPLDEEEEQVRQEALRAISSASCRADHSDQRSVKFMDEVIEEASTRLSSVSDNNDSLSLIGTRIECDESVSEEEVSKPKVNVNDAITTLSDVMERPNKSSAARLFQQIRGMLPDVPMGNQLQFLVDRLENGAMKSLEDAEAVGMIEPNETQNERVLDEISQIEQVEESVTEEERAHLAGLMNQVKDLTESPLNEVQT